MGNNAVRAQALYDLRDRYGFCSGKDLHRFFDEVTGDPSPSGTVGVPREAAAVFVARCLGDIKRNDCAVHAEIVSEMDADYYDCYDSKMGNDAGAIVGPVLWGWYDDNGLRSGRYRE